MVPIRHAVNNSIHNVFTTRIVPRYSSRQSAGQTDGGTAGASTGTASTSGATSPGSTPAAGAGAAADPAADFKALFGHATQAGSSTPAPAAAIPANPTVESVFGPNPYITNAGGSGPNGITYGYNPIYFATQATAQKLAQMYGGTVVEMNAITPSGPFQQNQKNQMIQFPNGNIVNAGNLAAYYSRGWSQEKVDRAIRDEINGISS
ncbi:MAG: hypothetical protein JST11_14310 [Acidobacteria bacterium]|nr:hypothetical protein [Acidobacteriota bacterium]